jgi:hypothetical protein
MLERRDESRRVGPILTGNVSGDVDDDTSGVQGYIGCGVCGTVWRVDNIGG